MAMKPAVRYTLLAAAVLAVLLVLALVVLTRTDFGVERTGRFAVEQIRGAIRGELEVERITSRGLLSGVTLHGVTLDGPDGRPFVRADSARLAYRFRTLLGGSLAFDRLILYSPDVVIERLPGEEKWNYQLILPEDTTATDTTRSLILIKDIQVTGGLVTVRTPWEPDGPVEPGDTARFTLESVPGGLVRTWRFEEVDARLPRIVWEAPGEDTRLIEIDRLSTRAFLWDTPLEIREAEGVVTIRDSLVSFQVPRARLPRSELALVGTIILDGADNLYDIQIEGERVAFDDFQWLYPPLPEEGGGTLQLRIQTQDSGSILWLAREARLQAQGSEIAGSFGVVTGDTLFFTNVDLTATPLDLDLLRSLLPTDLPLEGLLIGTVEVEGPISALETRGDVRLRTFKSGEGAESTVRWQGVVAGTAPFDVRKLVADIRELDLEQVAQFAPGLRVRGRATGRVHASGSLERGLDVRGDLALDRGGERSAVRGAGRFSVGGDRSAFDLRFDAEPVALDLLVEQFPGLGRVAGEARGPVTVTGTLDDLRVDADIMTPAGGVVLQGRFALNGPTPRYRAEGTVSQFQLDRVATDLPETVLTARFSIDGEGDRPATLDVRGSVDILSARVAGIDVRPSAVRGTISNGLVRIDSLSLHTEVGEVRAAGTLGILEGRTGELTVAARAHTLSRLEAVVFPEPAVPDELTGQTALRLDGAMDAAVVIVGSIHAWTARVRGIGQNLVYDGARVALASADVAWSPDAISVEASMDSIHHQHRRLAHARVSLDWSPSGGRLVARARGTETQQLDVEGSFERNGDDVELRLRQLELVTGEGRWAVADTVRARVGLDGVHIDSLVLLRAPRYARVQVAGTLPWSRPGEANPQTASLLVGFDSVRIAEVLRITQTDTTMDGVVSGQLRVTGTALSPSMVGHISARPFRYGGAVLDSVNGEVDYRDRRLQTRFAGWQHGAAVISGSGTVPLDLALTDRADRLLDEPVSMRIRAATVPAGLVAFLAPGFNDVAGTVDGELLVVGTTRDPELEGEIHLLDGTAVFTPLNVRYERIDGVARMGSGRLVEIDARLATGAGTGHIVGTLDLTRPRDPVLDLAVTGRNLQASLRRDVAAVATGQARVTGSYVHPVISGDVHIVRGEMNLDEIWRKYQIVQLDPSLFQRFDSTAVAFRPRAQNPFLLNLVLTDATLTADRDFWLRSRELNVEVSGSLALEVDRQVSDLRLTGSLEALTGNYSLQLAQGVPGRTFDIRGGTIEFMGTPGIDPDLDIAAGYRVRRPQGDPIDVIARVSGTLKDPRVALASDSDLPLSESDLASYILFGRSGAELTQAETDVLSSGIGLVRPVATGLVSTTLQNILAWSGVGFVDYVALTTPEYGVTDWQERGLGGVFHNTQLEIGIDAGRDVSLVVSGRIPGEAAAGAESSALWRQFGARVEWRFRPTWTTELYVEDRFARTPSFGFNEIDDRKVWGLSLFRDWGY